MARRLFKFWLDDAKSVENELVGQVDHLKKKRLFSATIRDGLRLMADLRKGSLDVLFELFPYVKAEFLEYMKQVQLSEQPLETLIRQAVIDGMKGSHELQPLAGTHSYINGSKASLDRGVGLQATGAPKPLVVPQFDVPVYDDEDDGILLEVKQDSNAGRQASENFLKSMLVLQGITR